MKRFSTVILTLSLLALTACGRQNESETIVDSRSEDSLPVMMSQDAAEDIPQNSSEIFQYAQIAQTDLDEYTTIFVDVYYNDIVTMSGCEYYSGVPYLVVQNKYTGRTFATSRIGTPLVSEYSALSPQKAYIITFEIDREQIIAVEIPIDESESCSTFYHYVDDMYGIYPCNTSEGILLSRPVGVASGTLKAEESGLADSVGRSYKFDFEKFPAYITISS